MNKAHRSTVRFRALLLAGAVALLHLRTTGGAAQTADSTVGQLAPLKVVDLAAIDTTINACTDFFQYANGAWLSRDTIPPDYSSSGVFRDMADRNELVVRSVLEDAKARRKLLPPASTIRKLGTFYASCMDSATAERQGLDPVRPLLKAAERITTRRMLIREVGVLQRQGVDVLFDFSPQVDPHDAAHYQAWFYQGGLGMPDRDYYTDEGPAADSVRQAYLAHIARYLVMAGASEAAAARDAGRVFSLETEMARASLTRVEQRDPVALDHPTSLPALHTLMPSVDWPGYMASVGMTVPVATVNVAMPRFFSRLDTLLATVPLSDWRAYLRYHILAASGPMLSTPWVAEDFTFRSRFTGAKSLLPRWKRCLRRTDGQIGEALGEAYVAKAFSPEGRAGAKAVIDDIRAAFGERLDRLSWMSDTTRAAARAKLAQMHEKVGYPEQWRDYTRLVVTEGPFVLNSMQADHFEWDRRINRPGAPVDTTEWDITVPTVNAYYDPTKNEMVFPAGALVPQTYDPAADAGANYGSLGASWAGHELTHGFDDEGRHYDATGNLRDWWAPEDSLHFTEQAAKIVEQYDGYLQVDTLHVNGQLTQGENIADYGGVLVGYDALERALERGGPRGRIDGYTPEQRFFLAYAQSYRAHVRPEQLRTAVTVDPHSPERWRVNGPLSNVEAFATAFGCKSGDSMVRPRELVPEIW
jgi:predicted metalloendopeptidase